MGVVSVGITKWFFYNQCQCMLKLFWEYVVTRIPGFSFNLPLVCFWASSHLVLFQSVSTELYNDEIPAQQPKEIFNKTLMIMCYFIQPRNKAKHVIDTPLCRIFIYIVVSCPCVCVWCETGGPITGSAFRSKASHYLDAEFMVGSITAGRRVPEAVK